MQRLYFCNDRLNISRLYYYFDKDFFVLSDKVDSIAKYINKKRTIDFTAWSEFVCFYYVFWQ